MENLNNEPTMEEMTHKVVVTFGSAGQDDGVAVGITLDPPLSEEEYEALDFKPACHLFMEKFVIPMLEEITMRSNFPELFDEDAPAFTVN